MQQLEQAAFAGCSHQSCVGESGGHDEDVIEVENTTSPRSWDHVMQLVAPFGRRRSGCCARTERALAHQPLVLAENWLASAGSALAAFQNAPLNSSHDSKVRPLSAARTESGTCPAFPLVPRSQGLVFTTASSTTSPVAFFRLGGGDAAEAGAKSADDAAGLAGKVCFVAGTLVLMADGSQKPIEKVQVGDEVVSKDLESGRDEIHVVKRTFKHDGAAVFDLTVDGEKVTATAEHPFYVVGRGWTGMSDLKAGDELLRPDGTTVAVDAVTPTGRVATVYNFEVEETHNYFVRVGDNWVLVHNTCEVDIDGIEHAMTVRTPEAIGVTGRTAANPAGVPTNIYTIIRDPYDGALVTMFPGAP